MDNNFDTDKYLLGKICRHGHEWGDTGFSLRYKKGNGCVECCFESTYPDRIFNPDKYDPEKKRKLKLEKRRSYYANNKDKVKNRVNNWRRNNKEKVVEIQKRCYEKNKEIFSERAKKYREEHKVEIAERHKTYYEENKDKFLEKGKIWRLNNAEKLKMRRKEYEIKVKGTPKQIERDKMRLARKKILREVNGDEIRRKQRIREKKQRDSLTDGYVRRRLTKDTDIPLDFITDDFIELKREQLKINRLLREMQV